MICLIVQARMNSQRLPGKVLRPVLGRPLLSYQIERLKRARLVDEFTVATSVNASDDPIVNYCRKEGISVYRGPEEDVLERFYGAALEKKASVIVRICADSPLVDPEVVDRVIRFYLERSDEFDYVCNFHPRTFPRGLDCEVFPFRVLEEVRRLAKDPKEREHVTTHVYARPSDYRIGNVAQPLDQSGHRWTVDTPEDLELITRILTALYPTAPRFTTEDVLRLLEKHPEWSALNETVKQKGFYE